MRPRARAGARRARLVAVVRAVLGDALLVAAYALRPLDRPVPESLLLLALGLLVLLGLVVLQVRAVARSPYPVLRAVEATVTTAVVFLLLFATGYLALSGADPGAFSEPLDHVGAVYLTTTVLATVGFGDVVPVSDLARVVVTVQMVCGLALVGLVGRQLLASGRRAREARHAPGTE